jgi:nucleoside-diphosphate-sugar epimerase
MDAGNVVLAAIRHERESLPPNAVTVRIDDLRTFRGWLAALEGVETVIHLAARAHVVKDATRDPLAEFRAVNVHPTIALFRACQQASVSRFIFVSSIGVNGVTTTSSPFRESDSPNPTEPYAISKWEAEVELRRAAEYGLTDLVVLRPALIYGPYAKGNLLRLMRWVDRGWPLPLGSACSSRSLLGLRNFCDLLLLCVTHPAASNELFVASDAQPVLTQELILALGRAMDRKVRMVRLPRQMLNLIGSATGRRAELDRLVGSLEVDPSKAKRVLNWTSGSGFSSELHAMVQVYLGVRNVR